MRTTNKNHDRLLEKKGENSDGARIITIPAQIRTGNVVAVHDPVSDLRGLIDEDMGPDVVRLLDEIFANAEDEFCERYGIDKTDGFYEPRTDKYRILLLDVMDALEELLEAPRLSKRRVTRLYRQLCEKIYKD